MSEQIAGVEIPDTAVTRDATQFVRDAESTLLPGFTPWDVVEIVRDSAWPE